MEKILKNERTNKRTNERTNERANEKTNERASERIEQKFMIEILSKTRQIEENSFLFVLFINTSICANKPNAFIK